MSSVLRPDTRLETVLGRDDGSSPRPAIRHQATRSVRLMSAATSVVPAPAADSI
jgi:hypothetical protein